MATSISDFFLCHVLYASLLLPCLIISYSKQGYALEGRKVTGNHRLSDGYHTIQVSSLLPSNACQRPSKVEDHSTSLEVVHRHGPCSQLNEEINSSSIVEAFGQDQLRVDWIHSRFLKPSGGSNDVWNTTDATTIPAKSGIPLGTGNFIITLQLGTPPNQFTLDFDTGSPLTWTQCQPCKVSCYNQTEEIFDPSKSTSYANISCSSSLCASLLTQGIRQGCARNTSTCVYDIGYGDGSESAGYLSTETLTLSNDVFNNFVFGCGQANEGIFGETAGLLGLSRGSVSIVEQTASKYNKVFSYCLPSSPSSTGFLTFGGSSSNSAKFTPLSTSSSSSFYNIDITGISVGGSPLSISSSVFSTSEAIIDSGTVITRLPPDAYSALRNAFREKMTNYKMVKSPISLFDTCYDFSGLNSVEVPSITFSFNGRVDVDISATGALARVDTNTFCLAFAGNSDPSSTTIFGNKQQETYEVIYDVDGGKLGFVPGRCD